MGRLVQSCACGASHRFWVTRLLHRALCTYSDPRKHWVPPPNSVQAWEAGPQRCYRCLLHEHQPDFARPCRGRRPSQVELA